MGKICSMQCDCTQDDSQPKPTLTVILAAILSQGISVKDFFLFLSFLCSGTLMFIFV